MTRWELIGKYYGELVNRTPRLKPAIVGAMNGLEVLGKWGHRLFWAALMGAVFFAMIGDILIYLAPSMTYGYAFKYNVDNSGVVINRRPHDCEWGAAPLGEKHCHYQAEVLTVRTGISKDGSTPLLSYDDGKTWTVNTGNVKPSVYVSWSKVDE